MLSPKKLRFDGPGRVDFRALISGYREVSLTGIVETLAERQLFGIGPKKASEVAEGPGIFEAAKTAAKGITQGVVFLDEIGELSYALQAKLLPVLSNGVFYRIGTEGEPNKELTFEGITITASWKPDLQKLLRPDLLSRLTAHVIYVPGLDERREDLPEIIKSSYSSICSEYKNQLERWEKIEDVDRNYCQQRAKQIPALENEIVDRLATFDWGPYGNLRALQGVLQRVVEGDAVDKVLTELSYVTDPLQQSMFDARAFVRRLMLRKSNGQGLVNHVKELEWEDRAKIKELLSTDTRLRQELGRQLSIDDMRLLQHVQQLTRSRGKKR
jgi:DNA-binding NtrC family response regulator